MRRSLIAAAVAATCGLLAGGAWAGAGAAAAARGGARVGAGAAARGGARAGAGAAARGGARAGAGAAAAMPRVALHAQLRRHDPGRSAAVQLTMRIAPAAGELVPPPLLEARLRYPAGLDVQLSGLGIEACTVTTLELYGPQRCPPDSLMGRGRAVAEVPIKGEAVRETAKIAIVRAAGRAGRVAMLLVAYGEPALSAQILLPALLLPARKPFGGLLDIHVPVVSTFPEGPDVSVSRIELVLGPKNLRYSERIRGRLVHYRPAGIPLPERCPRGGFAFDVQMSFLGGSRAADATAVRCRARGRRRAGRRRRRG